MYWAAGLLVIIAASTLRSSSAIEDTGAILCELCDCSKTREEINCRHLNIDRLPNFNASAFMKFNTVRFDDNEIQTIPPFPVNKFNVTILSFRQNRVNLIADAAFQYVGGLKEIDLSYNFLPSDKLRGDIFRGLYSAEGFEPLGVEVLKLSGNGLHTLDPDLFEHLPFLKELSLDSNPLTIIDHPTLIALANIPLLEYLDLTNTSLKDIPLTMLHTPKNLHVLNISFNNFVAIPPGLESTHNLESLIINGNPIEVICSSPYVPSLKRLELSSMPKLRRIGSYGLGNFTELRELFIVNNTHLFEIAKDALVHDDNFPSPPTWPQITKLNISYNKLAWLDSQFIANWDKIQEFGVSRNPWVCDCQNQWFLYELIPKIHKLQPLETEKLICEEPVEMRGLSMLELSKTGTEMRCLDLYGNHPENDGKILVVLISLLLVIPMLIGSIVWYRRNVWLVSVGGKFSYRRTGSLETIYQP